MESKKVSHRISFDQHDLDFIRDYKNGFGISIQEFVKDAVKRRINEIQIEETIDNMELIKKQ